MHSLRFLGVDSNPDLCGGTPVLAAGVVLQAGGSGLHQVCWRSQHELTRGAVVAIVGAWESVAVIDSA